MDNKQKVQTHQGLYLVLGMITHIVLMGILVIFFFKNIAVMTFIMKLNMWMGFFAAGLSIFIAKGLKFYADLRNYNFLDLQPNEDGYMDDFSIKGIRAIYLIRLLNFGAGVIVGVIFWVLPFTGIINK